MNGESPLDPATDWAQEQRAIAWLRFSPTLEQRFLRDYEQTVLTARQSLLGLGILLIALAPVLDLMLQPPPVVIPIMRTLQFGLMMPPLILALLVTLSAGTRSWSEPLTIAASLALGFGFIAERVIGAEHRFHVPHDIAALVFVSSLLLGRIRLSRYLPWGLLMMGSAITADLLIWGATNSNLFDQISSVLTIIIGGIGGYFLEHGTRSQWLQNQRLATQATTDTLTGIPNRRHFNQALQRLLRESSRRDISIDLLILDIDDFKLYKTPTATPLAMPA